MANRIGHGDDTQSERQCDTDKADADLRKACRDDGTAASRKCEPKCTDQFSRVFPRFHGEPPGFVVFSPGNALKPTVNSYPGLLAEPITPDLCDHTWPKSPLRRWTFQLLSDRSARSRPR